MYSLAELSEMDTAEPILRGTVDEAVGTLGPDHPLTLHARTALALTHRFIGDREKANAELTDLLPRLRKSPAAADDLVEALESHASVSMDLSHWDAAEASSREMLAVAGSHLGERHPLALSARWSLVLAGKSEDAAQQADQAFPLMIDAYRDEPKAPALIEARELYGRVLTGVGRLDEGISYIAQALDDAAEIFGAESMHIGCFGANLAARQLEVGDLDAALKNIDRGLAASVVVPGPTSGLYAFSHHVRGQILLAARKGEAALAQLNTAIAKLRGADDRSSQRLAGAQAERALALAYTGRVDQALADLRALSTANASLHILGIVQRLSGAFADALESERKALASLPPGPKVNRARSAILTGLGLTQIERGEWEPGAASLNEALALSRTLERRPVPDHADILIGLGRVALARQRPGDALPFLEEADRFWRQFDPQSRWSGETSLWLGRAYAALDRDADAAPALARARAILSRSGIPSDSKLARLAVARR